MRCGIRARIRQYQDGGGSLVLRVLRQYQLGLVTHDIVRMGFLCQMDKRVLSLDGRRAFTLSAPVYSKILK